MIDLEADKPSRKLWLLAALGALVIHVGCGALALAKMQPDEVADDLGAPAIEVGLEMISPRTEPTDLPPGPDTDASAASPAMPEQKAVEKESELPQAVPTETEEPDRVVTENDIKKPKEDQPEVAAVQSTASTESIAAEATAMPTVESVQESTKSVAPSQGTGASDRRAKVKWQKELVAHLDRHKKYPTERGQRAADITVSFTLDRTGHVQSVQIVKSSGDAAFDTAALTMVKRSDPVPAPPPLVADEGLTFTLPVIFRVKGRG